MKRARGSSAIAEACRSDNAGLAAKAARHQTSRNDRNHRTKMADHRVVTLARTPTVNVTIATAHRAELRAEIGPKRIEHRIPERHATRLIANQRRKNIAFAKSHTDGDAQRLLPAPQKDASLDQAAAIKTGELLLENARQEHQAIGSKIFSAFWAGAPAGQMTSR